VVVFGLYIKPMKTLFHGWACKANDRRKVMQDSIH